MDYRAEPKHSKYAFDGKVFKSDMTGNKSLTEEFKPDSTLYKEKATLS